MSTRVSSYPGRFVAAVSIFFLAVPTPAQQSTSATVVGVVVDPSQAAVAGATISVLHLDTGANVSINTDASGRYRTPPLRSGEYTLTFEAAGFQRLTRSGVILSIGDVREVNAQLRLGQVSDTVTVSAEAPLLQSADSTVGTVVGNQQIVNLPLNGRDYLQLAALSSGTVPSITNRGISIGGQAGYATAFLLDGIDNNNQPIRFSYGQQKEAIKPSVDAVQEFKVVVNGYSAEFGRSSAGVVSASIKSGTNQIHGTAYEFLRNNALDAKNFFATSKPPYKRNDFGASIGGPAIRNKLFWFGDFEIKRVRQSNIQVNTLPGIAQRAGQFSGPIYDPNSYDPATKTRQLFPGNEIPVSRFDPAAAKILSWFPEPQRDAATNNYVYASPANQDLRTWDFRVDQILSDSQNLFLRYSSQTQDYGPTSNLPDDPTVGNYTGASSNIITSHSVGAGYNKVWSPTVVSSIRAGWNYLEDAASSANKKNLNALIGLPGVDTTYGGGLATMSITGYTGVGGRGLGNISGSQTRQISGDVTWSRGAHTLKFGAQAYWLQTSFLSAQQTNGVLNFNGQYTRNPLDLSGGNALADFILGYSSAGSLSDLEAVNGRQPLIHFFAQDDWKVSRNLTLNLGLRYELNTPQLDKYDRMANLDIDANPASPQLVLAGSGGSDRSSRALQNVDHLQLAPRFGFAYSLPDSKTVLRGGYGIFFANMTTPGGMQSLQINPPYHLQVSIATDPVNPSLSLRTGFPADALSLANARNLLMVSFDRAGTWPVSQQWNFNVQHEFAGGVLVEVGYSGNAFSHGWRQFDGNPATPGPGNANANRRYKSVAITGTPYVVSLADVIRIQKDAYSRYNALQVKAEKRYSSGVTFLLSYQYSKTMALGENQSGGVQNPWNWAADRAVSSQDLTHRFVGSAVYALPFGRGQRFGSNWGGVLDSVFGGWSLSPIVSINSGQPLNLTVNGNPSNSGQGNVVGNNDRPNVVGDWHLSQRTVQEWFNTGAFVKNDPYTFGNAGRNILRGPGVINLDFSAAKAFRVSERVTAQLRLESFNATNTPHFDAPNTQVGNPRFGQISSAGPARSNQVGLKILF